MGGFEEIWRLARINASLPYPENVHWGYWAGGFTCYTGETCEPQVAGWGEGPKVLWTYEPLQRNVTSPDPYNLGESRFNQFFFDIERGVIVSDFMEVDPGRKPLALVGQPDDSGSPATRHEVRPVGARPAAVQVGFASASFVALLATLYFYPVLKFVATQAIVGLPGYAKLHRSRLLNNKFRDDLLQAIRNEPGVSPPHLQRRIGGGWSTIVYHLGVLERNRLVSSLIDGRHKRFFPVGDIDHGKRGQIAALKNARTKALFDLILEDPGVVQKDLAQRLGLSVPSTIWHVRRLEAADLIGSDRYGRKVHYFAKESRLPYDAKAAVEVT